MGYTPAIPQDTEMKTNTKSQIWIAFLTVTLSAFAQPRITTQPTNQTVNQGFSATFRSAATTTLPPLSYEWYFNSNAVSWALSNILIISNALPTSAGDYLVVATDSAGSVTSRVATLTVTPPMLLDPKVGP